MDRPDFDVLLAGAGLANGLIALELSDRYPQQKIALVDPTGLRSAIDHTWCLFETDVPSHHWPRLEGLLEARWSGYRVAFPNRSRQLGTGYACITGDRLAAALRDRPRIEIVSRAVTRIGAGAVDLDDGSRMAAPLIIDGRGARASKHLRIGFQKFVGLEVRLRRPHGLDHPIVMDATVAQNGDYRFIYVLPLGPDRLLVEDTRYADGPQLEIPAIETAVLRYARARRWMVADVLRREVGVLPVALDGDIDAYLKQADSPAAEVGLRGAFFHPTTGYSLPDALAVADIVAREATGGTAAVARALQEHARRLWRERGFYRLLNRMLFKAAKGDERYRVLERFYGLPQPLIERFYAGRSTFADKARVLSGRPPVPLWRALKAAPPAWRHAHVSA
ncbi:lycopene beta-cyclase CrtY [Caulobacter segnis]|uniref:lycopene beta-cyclase CrtY n=1 Tax=Caulobacter segnis TaxID=88688 RepID=UPI00240F6008|nr:lycopene beta-cyclase CrtY [Caulobacter segnis]MDG2520609.1 lycopene beta-cyclase CrtY [Caulobacter segnis]